MSLIDYACLFAIFCFTVGNLNALTITIKGPTPQDRVLGSDVMYVNCMMIIFTLGIFFKTSWYFEIALLISLVGFVGTLGYSKFLLRGEVIEP